MAKMQSLRGARGRIRVGNKRKRWEEGHSGKRDHFRSSKEAKILVSYRWISLRDLKCVTGGGAGSRKTRNWERYKRQYWGQGRGGTGKVSGRKTKGKKGSGRNMVKERKKVRKVGKRQGEEEEKER